MWQKTQTQIWIIVLAVIISFISIFPNEFVWDDEDLIVNWEAIRSYKNIPAAFIAPTHPSYLDTYRPIRFVLATMTYSLFGENPTGYHATTLAIHLACTLLIFGIVKKLTNQPYAPFLTSLLFGVHPVHTEAITWISSGLDMIGIVFLLLSLYIFLKDAPKQYGGTTSLIYAVLAYFSLELTIIFPALLALILWTQHKHSSWHTFRPIIPYGIGAITFLLLRQMFVPVHGEFVYIDGNILLTIMTMSRAFLVYLIALISPMNLTVNHALGNGISSFMVEISNDFPHTLAAIRAQRLTDSSVIMTILILVGSTTTAVIARKNNSLITLAIGWTLLALLPVSNIIPIHTLMAERYLYLSSFGFCLLLSIAFGFIIRTKPYGKQLGIIAISSLIIWYMTLTIQRNMEWKSNLSLWQTAVERNSTSYIAAVALGKQYLLRNDLSRATQTYENIHKIYPEHQALTKFLINLYIHQKLYQKALQLDPTNATAKSALSQ